MTAVSLPVFLSYSSTPHRHLHSFPTRRSSDLGLSHSGRTVFEEVSSAFGALLDMKTGMHALEQRLGDAAIPETEQDRKSTRLNSSHVAISYAVFCLKKKKQDNGKQRLLGHCVT